MSINKSNILDPDYSEAMIRIQQLHRKLQTEMLRKDYAAARNTARKIAVDAMLIGIWCRQFVDEPIDKE